MAPDGKISGESYLDSRWLEPEESEDGHKKVVPSVIWLQIANTLEELSKVGSKFNTDTTDRNMVSSILHNFDV